MPKMMRLIVPLIAALLLAVPAAAQETVNFQLTHSWGGAYLDAAFNHDESRYVLATPAGIEIYDLTEDDVQLVRSYNFPGTSTVAAAEETLAVAHYAGDRDSIQITLIDFFSGAITVPSMVTKLPFTISAMKFSPDSTSLAVLSARQLDVFEVGSGTRISTMPVDSPGNMNPSIIWSDDGRYIAVNNRGLMVYEPETNSIVFQSDFLRVDLNILFAHDLFVAYDPGYDHFWMWNSITNEFREIEVERDNVNFFFKLSLSPQLDYAIVSEGRDTWLVPFPLEGNILALTTNATIGDMWSPAGRFIYRIRSNPSQYQFFTVDEQMTIVPYADLETPLSRNVWSPDDRFLAGLVSVDEDVYSNYAYRPVIIDLSQPDLTIHSIDHMLSTTGISLPVLYMVSDYQVIIPVSCGMLTLDFASEQVETDFVLGCGDGGDGLIVEANPGSADGRLYARDDGRGRVNLINTDPNSPRNGEVLQTLDAGTGEVDIWFAGNDVLYLVSEDGTIRRYENP